MGINMGKKLLNLSKKLVLHLPIFMDIAVETLSSFTSLEAKKNKHEIKEFDTSLEGDFITAVMQFKGDIHGTFVLIVPNDIAMITIESLLDEKVDINDFDTLKDGIGEFCNIITGSIKTALSKDNINITFALPKTYMSLSTTKGVVGEEKGLWVDLELSKMPFYIFIA